MQIPVYNFETDGLEKSYLEDPVSAGATALVVKNNDRFAADDRIMIGKMGEEKTEIVTVSATSGGTGLTVGATVFPHSSDDPVTILPFDQVKYYYSTDGGENYSTLATVALDVDNVDLQTKYDHDSGESSYYYKFTFYHSIAALESDDSDVIKGSGWTRRQVGNIVDEILQEVSDQNEVNVTRTELIGYFNDVNDELTTNVSKPYEFLHSYTTLDRTADTNYIAFPVDSNGYGTMWKFDRMDYNFTDDDTSPVTDSTETITVIPIAEFQNRYSDNTVSSTTVSDDPPKRMALDEARDRFVFSHPFETTASDVFKLYYWKYFTEIDSEGDEIETPTAKIYKLYCKGMYYRKRAITENSYNNVADRYFADYQVEKAKYTSLNRRDQGTPRSFRPRSDTSTFRR